MQAFTRDAVVLSLALAAMWSYDPGSRPDPLPQSAPPVTYQVVGVVTDDAGSPLPGARIYFDFITSRSPGTQLSEISVTAGAGGAYSATFEAVPGAMKGPAGTDDAFAFARAWVECPSRESACSVRAGCPVRPREYSSRGAELPPEPRNADHGRGIGTADAHT